MILTNSSIPLATGPIQAAQRLQEARASFLQRRRGTRLGAASDAPFDADWLSLREPFDARARSRMLARRFAAMLPGRVTLVDLGAGTGNLFRWLAPILRRPQHWICLDNDAQHLARGLRLTAAWGRRLGYSVELDDDEMRLTLRTQYGHWTVQGIDCDLGEPASCLPLESADAVVCSALLDLFSRVWLDELLEATGRRPFYAALNVIGRHWRNLQDRSDALVLHGYFRNQVGDGSQFDPLGPDAPVAAKSLCVARGLQLASARSDWTICPYDRAMLRRVLAFHAGGARNALPRHCRHVDAWEVRRLRDVGAGRLAMSVAHRDLLFSDPPRR